MVELDDGSRWQIFPGDLDLTLNWKPETEIVVMPAPPVSPVGPLPEDNTTEADRNRCEISVALRSCLISASPRFGI